MKSSEPADKLDRRELFKRGAVAGLGVVLAPFAARAST